MRVVDCDICGKPADLQELQISATVAFLRGLDLKLYRCANCKVVFALTSVEYAKKILSNQEIACIE